MNKQSQSQCLMNRLLLLGGEIESQPTNDNEISANDIERCETTWMGKFRDFFQYSRNFIDFEGILTLLFILSMFLGQIFDFQRVFVCFYSELPWKKDHLNIESRLLLIFIGILTISLDFLHIFLGFSYFFHFYDFFMPFNLFSRFFGDF